MEGRGVPNVLLRARWWIAQLKSDEFSSSSEVVFESGACILAFVVQLRGCHGSHSISAFKVLVRWEVAILGVSCIEFRRVSCVRHR